MAGGPLKGGRDALGIPATSENAGKKTWQEVDGGKTVSIKTPQPIASGLTPVPVYGDTQSPSANSVSTIEELRKELEAKGAVKQKEDPITGGVHFACLVSTPIGFTLYEVDAADTAAAIRAVLAKIDQKR
jgi:hypothetical protein